MNDKELLESTFLKLLEDLEPQKLLKKGCSFDGKIVKIQNSLYNLSDYRNIYLFGSGKAVLPMAKGMQDILEERINKTLLVGAFADNLGLKNTTYLQSSHPTPSQKSIKAAKTVKQKLESLEEDEFFIYLLSGGTSSLMELPQDGISLEDISKTTDLMLKNAMPIDDMNCVRRVISQIKGGKLAKNIKADGIVLVLSDVLGDDLGTIGSGPLYPNNTTASDAISRLEKHKIFNKIPKRVKEYLLKSQYMDYKQKHKKIEHFIVGSNKTVLQKAKEILQKKIETTIVEQPLREEVKSEARRLLNFAKENSDKRACFLFGAECTVKVKKEGYGGRNQHLALSFLEMFDFDFGVTLLCGATDGVDGNSDAAGAIVETYKIPKSKKYEIKEYLKSFNSNLYFKKTKGLLKTRPTHNNLLDITMLLIK